MDDIFVYLAPLPDKVNEFVCRGYDGYTIYIDSGLDKDSQSRAYNHAMRHITGSRGMSDVQQIESEAHI